MARSPSRDSGSDGSPRPSSKRRKQSASNGEANGTAHEAEPTRDAGERAPSPKSDAPLVSSDPADKHPTLPNNGAIAVATAAAAAADGAPAAAPDVRKAINMGKTGGVYIPPFKLARMMQSTQDRSSPEYQRLSWEALKKSINGIINKVNAVNIKNMLAEVFRENLQRGRGLFCRSMMKSQMASPTFSPVYAALVAVVNTKFPELGELLLHRLVLQFMRSYKRNDKPVCTAAARFLAQLINQGVAHEVLALEMLILMLEQPSGDSVEMACDFVKEVGAYLQDVAPQGLHSVFERFRAVLHEGEIEKRVQFVIENLFAVRKAGFAASGFPAVKPELDLVEAEDQITHEIGLEDSHEPQTHLDIFKVDPEYEANQRAYKVISREILGEEEDDDEDAKGGEGDDEGGDNEDEDEEPDEEEQAAAAAASAQAEIIKDQTQTNEVNLRRTIYLTIMSSMDFEEAGHKLVKIKLGEGQEHIMVEMILECCSQERTYKRFFGLLAQRFCYLKREYAENFDQCFRNQYAVIHRLETNKLRNIASLFSHLLATDALSWSVMECMRITEEDTTSASRIFIKYLFQELSSTMGVLKLAARMNDPAAQGWYDNVFPKDTQANLRFAINFFTSIGLGGLTDSMRAHYAEMPRLLAEKKAAEAAAANALAARRKALGLDDSSDSSSDSDSSDSSSSSSSSSSSDSSSSDSSSSDSSSSSSDSSSDSSDSSDGGKKRSSKKRAKGKAKNTGQGKGSDRQRQLPPPPSLPPPPPPSQGGAGRHREEPAYADRDGYQRGPPRSHSAPDDRQQRGDDPGHRRYPAEQPDARYDGEAGRGHGSRGRDSYRERGREGGHDAQRGSGRDREDERSGGRTREGDRSERPHNEDEHKERRSEQGKGGESPSRSHRRPKNDSRDESDQRGRSHRSRDDAEPRRGRDRRSSGSDSDGGRGRRSSRR